MHNPHLACVLLILDIRFKSVGNLRFAPSEPPLKFTGVRQATSFGAACIQQAVTIASIPGAGGSSSGPSINVTSEDCTDYHLKLWL